MYDAQLNGDPSTMPITKEHMKKIVDEGLAMRDYHDEFRSEMVSVCAMYLNGQDSAICMEIIVGMSKRQRPPMELTFAESQKLKRNWKANDWQKRHQAMRRVVAQYGGNPDDVQMHPHPISGSKFTHITPSVDIQAITERAHQRAEWIAERLAATAAVAQTVEHVTNDSTTVTPLTEAEAQGIAKPDGQEALPTSDEQS